MLADGDSGNKLLCGDLLGSNWKLRVWNRGQQLWPSGFEDLGTGQPQRLWKLYSSGDCETDSNPRRCIAVVGSRKATAQGRSCALEIGERLSRSGICVISGLARGIDAAALLGALRGPVPPVAILGNGLPQIYPAENQGLAQNMIEAGGVVVSEYPPGTPPRGFHFPQRNRLISAWSEAVVVVEATRRSGSMGTAHRALEMGRTVLTFPGAVETGKHAGCHSLIREGALLIESASELMEWVSSGRDPGNLQAEERRLQKLWKICGWDKNNPEPPGAERLPALQRQTGWSAAFLLQVWWRWQERHGHKS